MNNQINDLNGAPKRVDLASEPDFRLGGTQVRPSARELIGAAGREILEPKVMQVLVVLVRAQGATVSREDLTTACWDGRVVGEDAITRVISKLRRLSETAGGFNVETITKVGYRLTAAAVAPDTRASSPTLALARIPRRTWIIAAIAVLLLGVGALFAITRTASTGPTTVAILPFYAPDPDTRYIAIGIRASLAQSLNEIGVLVATPAGAPAAQRAHAVFIIAGDVRRDHGGLHVNVRVEDTRRGLTVLSKSYDGSMANIERLRDQIAMEIVGTNSTNVTWRSDQPPEITAALFRIRTLNDSDDRLAAYEAARVLVQMAPNNALAQLTFAIQTARTLGDLPPSAAPAALAAGRVAADRAYQLNHQLGGAWIAQYLLTPSVEWSRREAVIRRAVDQPNDASYAPFYLGQLYRNAGRLREAEPLIALGAGRDPLSVFKQGEHISVLLELGQRDEAAGIIARGERLWRTQRDIVERRLELMLMSGAFADAEAYLDQPEIGRQLEPPRGRQPLHAIVRALQSHRATDIDVVEHSCGDPPLWRMDERICLIALAQLGRLDAAFALAQRMYPDQRAPSREAQERLWLETQQQSPLPAVLFYPQTAPMRADPRFVQLAENTGLMAYWRESGHRPDFCATERTPVCGLLH